MHVDKDLQKLKADQKFIGWAWSNMGVASQVWDSKMDCVSKAEQMEWTDFLHACTNSRKLKVDSMIFGWAWSKMAEAFTLKSGVS